MTEQRCAFFRSGAWPSLLAAADAALRVPAPGAARAGRTDEEARAARASALVHLGELSAAGRALVSEPLAPGSPETLRELRDPSCRPQAPYSPLGEDLLAFRPEHACNLPLRSFLASLRHARRGSAAGPSGATNERLRYLIMRRTVRSCTKPPRGSRARRSRGPSSLPSGSGVLSRSANLMVVCARSSLGTCCAGLSAARWRSCTLPSSRMLACPSNMMNMA